MPTRRPPNQYQQTILIPFSHNLDGQKTLALPFSHPQVTATTTRPIWKVPTGKTFRVDRIVYYNSAGLVADNTNAFRGEIKNGSTLIATVFNTDGDDSPAGASLAAATAITPTLVSAAIVLAASDELSLVLTEDGAATLPEGYGVIEGRLLDASATRPIYKVPTGRKLRVDRIVYYNPVGLTGDNTNAFRAEIKNGSTLIATLFNTDTNDTPAGASLAAGTAVEPSIVAAACVLAAAEELSLVLTEDGTATLPEGYGVIEARLL